MEHIDPDERMTFAYLDKDEVPVLCSWFEWKEWWKRDRSGALMYLVFDLLYLNKEDLMGLPLVRRREILKKLLPKEGSIRFSDAIEGRGIEFFRAARERGLEGVMAKRKGSRYMPGRRSENWLKIKARMQQEAVIGGITEPSGGRHYFGALMLGVYDKGRLLYVGHTGTGFSEALLKDLFAKLTPTFTGQVSIYAKTKSQCAGQMGRAQVRLRGRIPGVDNRRQNEGAELSRTARR